MGKHSGSRGSQYGTPKTGDGKTRSRPPITKAESAVRSSDGGIMWKATSKLFGIMGNKKAKGK